MKKRMIAFLLCAVLLTGSVFAAGGDASDPLISLNWLRDTFIPEMAESFSSIADKTVKEYQTGKSGAEPAVKSFTLRAGESLTLREGQYFILSSGSAVLTVEKGAAVNATQGWETSGGPVRSGNRYIFCEEALGYLDAATDCTVTASAGAEVGKGCPFTDVKRGAWYYTDVLNAYERGLVSGMTLTTYEPSGTLTIAQCVKLAACMHQLYHEDEVTLGPAEGAAWYLPFVEYALENGILDAEETNYNAVITRRQFVELFYRALPASGYQAINSIPDGAIPDVGIDAANAEEIYAFYRAGILIGYTQTPGYAEYAFGPGSSITRAEVAAIMSRMFDPSVRVRFSID